MSCNKVIQTCLFFLIGALLTPVAGAVSTSGATLIVNFPGVSSVHTDARESDGIPNTASGAYLSSSNWRSDSAILNVPTDIVDVRIRKGSATYIVDDLDCSSGFCEVSDITATVHVAFPGLSSVHTDARVVDGELGVANGGSVASSNWKSNNTSFKVFKQQYDFRIRKGAASFIADNVDCTSGDCAIDGFVTDLHVSFPGLSSVHTNVRLSDGVDNLADGGDVTSANWKSNQTVIKVLPGIYDLRIRKGQATTIVDNVDCTLGSCTVEGLVANLTVNFSGLSSVHTEARLPDGIEGTAEGGSVTASNWKSNSTTFTVLRQVYDLRIRKGASEIVVDEVDCTGLSCSVDDLVVTMTVNFDGLSSVHTDVRTPDNLPGSANGQVVTSSNWKSNQTEIKLFRGVYDLRIRKGAATHIVDDVDCSFGNCEVADFGATMNVEFPGMSSVHTDVRIPDGVDQAAEGAVVTNSNWKSNGTVIKVFPQSYDVKLRKGPSSYIVDNVDCSSGSCLVSNIVREIQVEFTGMSSVHTDVRLPDSVEGTATGNKVSSSNWKTDNTNIKVLPGIYDLRLRKGAADFVVDEIDCISSNCEAKNLARDLNVRFPGMSSVHTDVRLPDDIDNEAGGGLVTKSNWKRESTTIKVFLKVYDLRIRKGAAAYIVDEVDCRQNGDCIADDLTAELTVQFAGMSQVHTDVRVPDGADNAAAGGVVTTSNWKTNGTTVNVFRQEYDLRLRKGASVHFVDEVDCTSGTCLVDDLVADMTVNFQGMSQVHTGVRVPDGTAGTAEGEVVTKSNWKSNSTNIKVFPQKYDLRLRKGGASYFVDDVDCSTGICEVNNLTAILNVAFPGLGNVHTDVRVPDGIDNQATGEIVTKSNWKSHETDIMLFRQQYDVKVNHGVVSVFDRVDCSSGACNALITGNLQVTLINGDINQAIAGKYIKAYEKLVDGSLVYRASGTTNPQGLIHFTLPDLGNGKTYVLKTWNPLGLGKSFYTQVFGTGPFSFVVTEDGDNTLDLTPPEITISAPLDGANVGLNGFSVTGTATDNRSISSIVLNVDDGTTSTDIPAQYTSANGTWIAQVPSNLLTADLALSLTATASDPARNSTSDSILVTPITDNEGPLITFTSHQDQDMVPVTGFLLSGQVTDLTGIGQFTATLVDPVLGTTIDAADVEVSLSSGSWTLAVKNGDVTEGETVTITMDALDSNGNPASASIELNIVPVSHAGYQVINRLSFGASPELFQDLSLLGVDGFISQQLNPGGINDDLLEGMLGNPTSVEELQAWTLQRMVFSRRQLLEVMTWFWENHFNTDINTTRTDWEGNQVSNTVAFELAENQAFRTNALGNFRTLLGISARSPSMLIYLDSISNVAGDSNENYSREVMELSTLGVGNFTEADVEAGAQIFTGWHLDIVTGQFVFNADQHTDVMPDGSMPVILGNVMTELGEAQGDRMLDILAEHRDTAEYICTKLSQLFINDNAPAAMVNRCADTFQANVQENNQIELVLGTLFSNEFFDLANYRAKIKTPVEFVTGVLRNLAAQSDGTDLADAMQSMGLRLYQNPVPTGYSETGDDWINSSLLIERIKWANDIARSDTSGNGTGMEPLSFFPAFGFETSEGIVGFLLNLTVGDDFTDLARQQALDLLNGVNGFDLTDADADERLRQLIGVVLSYPSYQYQ